MEAYRERRGTVGRFGKSSGEDGTLRAAEFCEGWHIKSSEELEGESGRRGGRASGRGGMRGAPSCFREKRHVEIRRIVDRAVCFFVSF